MTSSEFVEWLIDRLIEEDLIIDPPTSLVDLQRMMEDYFEIGYVILR